MIGPGGVGKTSLLNGLKDKPLPPANSTQLAETSTVKPQKWSRAIEDPESPWTDVTEDDEIDEIVGLVQLVRNVKSGGSTSSRFYQMAKAAAGVALQRIMRHRGTGTEYQNEVIQAVDEILSRAVKVGMKNPGAQAPESEVMLHVWDCGGQPVFLDVLPPFLTSRTMFMLMFDASKNLHEKCVAISHQDGAVVRSEQYHDTTTMELLLQWMATIHATLSKQGTAIGTQCHGDVPSAKSHKENNLSEATTPSRQETAGALNDPEYVSKYPRILPIGTHGDVPSVKSHKEKILSEISLQCENKSFAYLLRPGVIVDNTKAGRGDSEDPAFKEVRKQAYKFANEDLKIPTPITWVLFRKVFKKLAASKPLFYLDEVKEIATACGIKEGTVQSVLKFYHDLAVFFHYAHIPSLKEYVIADVQWLINLLAKVLALEGFKENKSSLLWKPLREKGILVQPLCEEVWKGCGLPPKALLDLMESFLLLAPIHSEVYPQHPGREYFIPSVLKPFNAESYLVTAATALKKAAPLHLRFNTQYVPPGFFSRLATLLTKEDKCHVLFKDQVYRNRISILYGETNNQIDRITISELSNSIQVEVTRMSQRKSQQHIFSMTCREILKLIQECSVSILEFLPGVTVSPAFVCEHWNDDEDHLPHFVEFLPNASTQSTLQCENVHTIQPTQEQQCWLKVLPNEEGLCDSQLSPPELKHLAAEIPPDKIREVSKCLEMDHLSSQSTSLPVLERWFKEMQKLETMHIRAHLVHFLRISGLQNQAEKVKYGEYLDAGSGVSNTSAEEASQLSLPLTEIELLQCSRFIIDLADYDLSSLAPLLNISDAEFESICSRYKKPQGQLYQMLKAWYTSTQSSNKRQYLIGALEATNLSVIAKRLESTNKVPVLADLLKYVTTAKWYRLGVFLGLDPNRVLDMIEKNHNETEDKLTQMFQAWLKRDPSWSKMVQALDDMGLKVLASDIKEKFCVL